MSTLDSPNMIETTAVSKRSIGIRYGAMAALVTILIGLVFHLAGLTSYTDQNSATNWIATLLNWVVMAGAMYMGMNKFKEESGGYLTFGQGFNIGLWASLILAIISAVWMIVFFQFVEPGLTETIIEATREKMLEQGQSEEQVDQAMQYTAMFMKPGMFALFGGIGIFITGLIIALITAAIAQRKPPMDSVA
jgi:hypothetical protein